MYGELDVLDAPLPTESGSNSTSGVTDTTNEATWSDNLPKTLINKKTSADKDSTKYAKDTNKLNDVSFEYPTAANEKLALLLHLNAMGDYYDVKDLQAASSKKTEEFLKAN